MKPETIKAHVRTLNGIIASFDHAKKVEGQTAKERGVVELLQDARANLLEELEARREKVTL